MRAKESRAAREKLGERTAGAKKEAGGVVVGEEVGLWEREIGVE
jgi:hypothetical protein